MLFDLEDRVKAWISVAHRTPLVTFAAALKLKFHRKYSENRPGGFVKIVFFFVFSSKKVKIFSRMTLVNNPVNNHVNRVWEAHCDRFDIYSQFFSVFFECFSCVFLVLFKTGRYKLRFTLTVLFLASVENKKKLVNFINE